MSRKPSTDNHNDNILILNDEVTTSTPPRTRTPMHTARIMKYDHALHGEVYLATHDRDVTAAFKFDTDNGEFAVIEDVMGAYAGYSKYIRTNTSRFTTIYTMKSEDDDVVSVQADRLVAENFVRSYIDKKATKATIQQLTENVTE